MQKCTDCSECGSCSGPPPTIASCASALLLPPPAFCSVLLGHREPPAAVSVIEGDQITSDEDEQEDTSPSSFQSAVGRSAVSSSFDAKSNNPFTKPAVSSRSSTPGLPLGRRSSGPSASPSLAPGGGGSRVRFGVYGEQGHAKENVPEKTQRRKHRESAPRRDGLDGREEAGKGPLISDLSGPSLLQVDLRPVRYRLTRVVGPDLQYQAPVQLSTRNGP